jgi:hypothetical protein
VYTCRVQSWWLRLTASGAAVGAVLVGCFYEVPDIAAPTDGGPGDGDATDGGGASDGSSSDVGLEIARTKVCASSAVGRIAATASGVMVVCADGNGWDPSAGTAPSGTVNFAKLGGAFGPATTVYPGLATSPILLATATAFVVATNDGKDNLLARADNPGQPSSFACYAGSTTAGATADGFAYWAGASNDANFGNGLFRGLVSDACSQIVFQCKDAACAGKRIAKLPDGHVSGGVAVLGTTIYAHVCNEPSARVYAFPRDGSSANQVPAPVYDTATDVVLAGDGGGPPGPDAATVPTCAGAAPPGLAALGQQIYFGVDARLVTCAAGGACSTVLRENAPVRAVTADAANVYWAVGTNVRRSAGQVPTTRAFFAAPDTVTAIAAGNGQPNVYVGTRGGDVIVVR